MHTRIITMGTKEPEAGAGGGTIVSVHPRQVAVLCLEQAQAAPLNRMEKYDGSKAVALCCLAGQLARVE